MHACLLHYTFFPSILFYTFQHNSYAVLNYTCAGILTHFWWLFFFFRLNHLLILDFKESFTLVTLILTPKSVHEHHLPTVW